MTARNCSLTNKRSPQLLGPSPFNDVVCTTLYDRALIALNRHTSAIVDRLQLPTSTNSPIAIAGNPLIVSAGGPHHEQRRKRPAGRGVDDAVRVLTPIARWESPAEHERQPPARLLAALPRRARARQTSDADV
jgi:hypothetical protein